MQSSSSSSQFSDCSSLLQGLLSIQLELFSLRCDVFGDCHWLGIAECFSVAAARLAVGRLGSAACIYYCFAAGSTSKLLYLS